jgi:hypothetical protein
VGRALNVGEKGEGVAGNGKIVFLDIGNLLRIQKKTAFCQIWHRLPL